VGSRHRLSDHGGRAARERSRFHSLIVRFRAAAGVEVLVRDDPAIRRRGGRRASPETGVVAMLIDQDTRGARAGGSSRFVGRPAQRRPAPRCSRPRAVPVVTV